MSKSPYEMTVAELQAEIGRLQMILNNKVWGSGRTGASPHTVYRPPATVYVPPRTVYDPPRS